MIKFLRMIFHQSPPLKFRTQYNKFYIGSACTRWRMTASNIILLLTCFKHIVLSFLGEAKEEEEKKQWCQCSLCHRGAKPGGGRNRVGKHTAVQCHKGGSTQSAGELLHRNLSLKIKCALPVFGLSLFFLLPQPLRFFLKMHL